MIAGWNFKTTEILKVKIKNLSNWFVLLVCRTLHVSQLLVQTLETHQLVCDPLAQGSNCGILQKIFVRKLNNTY